MKKLTTILILLLFIGAKQSNAQRLEAIIANHNTETDSLMHALTHAKTDTGKIAIMVSLCNQYMFNKPDSALFYGYGAINISREIGFPKGEVEAMQASAIALNTIGNFSKAFQITLQGVNLANTIGQKEMKGMLLLGLGHTYTNIGDYKNASKYFREAFLVLDSLQKSEAKPLPMATLAMSYLGNAYLELNNLDSASFYTQKAYEESIKLETNWLSNIALINHARVVERKGHLDLAKSYLHQATEKAISTFWLFHANFDIAKLHFRLGESDSAIFYGTKSLDIANASGIYTNIIDANEFLSQIYREIDFEKALAYSTHAIAYNDSLTHLANITGFETIAGFDEQQREFEIATAETAFKNRFRQILLLSGLGVIVIIALIIFRGYRKEKQAKYSLLQKNHQVESALRQLKSTQAQLIQAEKMASLGELTAGIAHEIQNPLNFVNNFSEVNRELVEEATEELEKGDIEEAKSILRDLGENSEKINQHGKRADAIVKGMLEHSRANKGEKAPTDLNALADEFVRLSYHGLRAKDKSFNADFKLELDPDLPKVNVVASDIGRVILNLVNNAFYACAERSRSTVYEKSKSSPQDYKPEVIIKSKKTEKGIELSVQDNGNGIPDSIKEKIFQPFFTTKPTGSGTGLGLSLSYDIVKAHGGELRVVSEEGEGTTFIISLPYKFNHIS
ncbi:tetratricopeptide repeat-containing sensor histidine kinase [Algoriphagus marinus]|uniref:tetratricopeptide repeat-containing sensor histidine kinase n=1 Tax=Algoriphagus marinus TaxID=1925762 RepID=UPI00094BC354|nr:ATP-binding protein [Algoriphagus marinus]